MSTFSMFRGFVALGAVLGMFSGMGEVRAELKVPIPLALQDMNATTKLDLDIGLIPTDSGFGLGSRVGFFYGNGTFAGGVYLPFVLLFPDNEDDTFVLGNPTGNFTLTSCFGGTVCLGGSLDLGVGVFPIDDDTQLLAMRLGNFSFQNNPNFSAENLALRPMGLVSVRLLGFYVQAQLGLDIFVPIQDTAGRETEMALAYGLCVGYPLFDLIVPMIEFHGYQTIDQPIDITGMWMNIGARLQLSLFQPFIRFGIPLNDDSKAGSDVFINFGFALLF